MNWVYLALAIVFEVGWAVAMKLSAGFTRPWPMAATLVLYVLSLVALAQAVKAMEVGMAYAMWAGLGAAIIAAVGIFYFHEPVTFPKIASMALIVLGVVGLNLFGTPHGANAPAAPTPPATQGAAEAPPVCDG